MRPETSRPDFYTVGWVCAIPTEHIVACELLDEQYKNDIPKIDPQRDSNLYTFGRAHDHNIVIACLPNGCYGITYAALVAERMRASFPALRFGLLVGIAGGAPSKKHDIRLGDIVVSSPTPRHGGVIQYDYGKELGERGFEVTGYLAPPPQFLLNALSFIQTEHARHGHRIAATMKEMLDKNNRLRKKYSRPDPASDVLYEAEGDGLVAREDRDPDEDDPVIHYGLIASANQLVKDSRTRDALIAKHDVLCFEMEAAGMMSFPCLVIRGICDYSDSHKNDDWQGYASATSAAYAKELLKFIPRARAELQSSGEASIADKKVFKVHFDLAGLPIAKKFFGRTEELREMEKALLPNVIGEYRKIFVLCGLGGIGKTQLAIEFMRLYKKRFSAIIWLDGCSKNNLEQSITRFVNKLAINEQSMINDNNINNTVAKLLSWLSLRDNSSWLLVFDNVNSDIEDAPDNLAYDIRKYFPTSDHGSILITTRVAQLEQLGQSQQVKRINERSAFEILSSWYKKANNDAGCQYLLRLMDGLPLAIVQAGAYLQQSGMHIKKYLQMYEKKNAELDEIIQRPGFTLNDYPERNVQTTWTISYEAVFESNKSAAHLLLFWSCCDRLDFWHGLLENAVKQLPIQQALRDWIGDIAEQEASFIQAMELLRNYSLIEGGDDIDSYSMHPVVYRWAFVYRAQHNLVELEILAFFVVAFAAPASWMHGWWARLERILPHAHACQKQLFGVERQGIQFVESSVVATRLNRFFTTDEISTALQHLANLNLVTGRNDNAVLLLDQVFRHQMQTLGIEHTSTLTTMSMLGLAFDPADAQDAKEMWLKTALISGKKILGEDDIWTLNRAQDLGYHYLQQGRLDEAEVELSWALMGKWRTRGTTHPSTLDSFRSLGWLYRWLGQPFQAQEMWPRAVISSEKALGTEDEWTITTLQMLGDVYWRQGNLSKAEKSYQLALFEYETLFVPEDQLALWLVHELAEVRTAQGKFEEAKKNFLRVLRGYEKFTGTISALKLFTLIQLSLLYVHEDRSKGEKRSIPQNEQGYEGSLQPAQFDTKQIIFQVTRIIGRLHLSKGPKNDSKEMISKLLSSLTELLGDSPQILNQVKRALLAFGPVDTLPQIYDLLKQWLKESGYSVPSTKTN